MPHSDNNVLSSRRATAIQQRERVATQRAKRAAETRPSRKPTITPREETEFLGRSEFSPLQMLRQEDRTTGRKGIPGEFIEGLGDINAAVGETISEAGTLAGRGVGGALDVVAALDPPVQGMALAGFFEENQRQEPSGLTGAQLFSLSEIDEDPTTATPRAGPSDRRDMAIQARLLTEKQRELQQTDDALAARELDPTDALAVQQIREGLEVELAQVEVDLLDLTNQLGVQDLIFEISAENAGLADSLDLNPLENALSAEGGLGHQTYQAILDLANNAALSEQQRDEAIDIVLARQHFSEELIDTVNDLVDTKNDLEEIEQRSDVELLDNAAEFVAPQLNFDVFGANDSERFLADMLNSADEFLEVNVPATIPPGHESFDIYGSTILLAMEFGVDNLEVQDNIALLAEIWDTNEGALVKAISDARDVAVANKLAWDEALDAEEARPFSGNLVAAIWQAGEEIGWNPDQLEMAAKSRDLHVLIDTKSQGKSGQVRNGTIAGMGGLTRDMYEELMGEEWTPQRGMSWELQALLKYIDVFFQGDALKAVRFYRDSGEWGGSGTMSGG